VDPFYTATNRHSRGNLWSIFAPALIARLAEEAVSRKQSHLGYLEALLEAEIEERERRAVVRRIKEAHFPAVKTLEEFDFQSAPHLPAAQLRRLSEGEYL
jgi:DNA replication protein DnaC